jgi:hypothetical protein
VNIAESIYETVKALPEQTACEVLNFAEGLIAKQVEDERIRRENALATLTKYSGRLIKVVRDDCYER